MAIRSGKSKSAPLFNTVNIVLLGIAAVCLVLIIVLLSMRNKRKENFIAAGGPGFGVNLSGIVTLYHMEGCKYCNDFKDEWAQFKLMAKDKQNITTAEKEASNDSADVKAANVTGFPTIRLTIGKGENAKTIDYDGDRTANALFDWTNAQLRSNANIAVTASY